MHSNPERVSLNYSKSSQHAVISNSNDCHLEKQSSSIGNILNKYLPSTRPPGGAAAIFKPAMFTESRKKRLRLRNMLSNILIHI